MEAADSGCGAAKAVARVRWTATDSLRWSDSDVALRWSGNGSRWESKVRFQFSNRRNPMPNTKSAKRRNNSAKDQFNSPRGAKLREHPETVISPAITNGAEQPVTSAQLARHLQVTPRTLASWRAQGKVPYWRINPRNFRYRIRDVETALSLSR